MSTIREELNWCDHLLSSPLRKAVLLNNDTNFKNDEINTIYEDGEGLLLKILSWNILAECYTNPRSHPNLPDEYSSVVFNKTKRRSLLFKILKSLAESFDVLCLQELDLYEECVEALDNFDSCHSTVHPRADCCAIFWKKDKFDLVESRTIKFDDLAQVIDREEKERGGTNKAKVDPSDDPRNTPARKQRSTTTGAGGGKPTVTTALNGMVQCFLRRNTASIAVLQQKAIPHHKFAVASTHFYWNPGYEFVKLAQAKFLLDKLHEMVMRNSSSSLHSAGPVSVSTSRSSTHRMPVFVCGDFNTTPGSIVHTFMAQGNVDARTVAPWNSTTTNPSDLLSIDPSASSSSISTVSLSSWNKTKYKNTSNFFHDYDDPTDEMFGNGKFYLFGHHTRFPFSDCSADKIAALTQKLKSGKLIYEGQGQVKYMLDFTLNRLSRWLRILGLDAAVESEREERQRTSCTNKQKIPIFERCKHEGRVLLTTSIKLPQRKDCPSGTYLINPKELELAFCHILLLHGVILRPEAFLSRCVVCNGALVSVNDDSTREELLAANNAPSLPNISVFACRRCLQCYWWSDRPNSSASRVMNAASHLFSLALRAGVPYEGDLGVFNFIDPIEEKEKGHMAASLSFPRVEAFEWLKCSSLKNKFNLRSAYSREDDMNSELLPFTNVTRDFVNTLDYIFFEPHHCTLVGRLEVPTSFKRLNYMGIPNGHLLPSNLWPSDHLAIGSAFLLTNSFNSNRKTNNYDLASIKGSVNSRSVRNSSSMSSVLSLRASLRDNASNTSESDTNEPLDFILKNGSMGSKSSLNKGPVLRSASDSSSLPSPTPFKPHERSCKCGCVPKDIFSLFEMAEMRKQQRKQQKQLLESKN